MARGLRGPHLCFSHKELLNILLVAAPDQRCVYERVQLEAGSEGLSLGASGGGPNTGRTFR